MHWYLKIICCCVNNFLIDISMDSLKIGNLVYIRCYFVQKKNFFFISAVFRIDRKMHRIIREYFGLLNSDEWKFVNQEKVVRRDCNRLSTIIRNEYYSKWITFHTLKLGHKWIAVSEINFLWYTKFICGNLGHHFACCI